VNDVITSLNLTPVQLLFVVIVFYVILGMVMETLSMMVATLPIVAPVVFKAGYDPVWYGVLFVILIETAMITPPVGINLYVVQGLRKSGRINDVIAGASPFVFAMFAMLLIISIWPDLALWLPRIAGG
jgi:C4-dicarboxylate transporter DctM subunit